MRMLIAAALALTLAGCSLATGYHPMGPMGLMGGYSDEQLSPDTYKIHVLVNVYTPVRQAGAIALLRAAELTLNAGYQRFVVVSGDVAERDLFGQPVSGPITFINGGTTVAPSGDVIIRLVKPNDPDYQKAADAAQLAQSLRKALGVTASESTAPIEPHLSLGATPHS